MAYRFDGFFVTISDHEITDSICHEVQSAWPASLCRPILSPFIGVGVCWTHVLKPREQLEELDRELGVWTQRFPTLAFVRISAECFGGLCDYGGTVWRNKQILLHEDDWTDDLRDEPLLRLLGYLEIVSEDAYFEPFTRGYFG